MDGSGSSDSDGTIISYEWSDDGVVIATGVNPQVDLAVGVHTIILTVTDDDGDSKSSFVSVEIRAESPMGFDENLQRAVRENARHLKVESAEFEV